MDLATLPRLTCLGQEIDTSPENFGELLDSSDIANDFPALRERMEEEGYLYLPGYLNREEVLEARAFICRRLNEDGLLDPDYPVDEAVGRPGVEIGMHEGLGQKNPTLHKVLYAGPMMEFYAGFLGGEVRHFDYTWLRVVSKGLATPPHCDIVYMGRGTKKLYTSWTPLGDIPIEQGGLLMLEKSHRHDRLNNSYGKKDVDAYCVNRRPGGFAEMGGGGNIQAGGVLSRNPVKLRKNLGGRYLTSDYRAGDLMVFSMFTVHTSLDNRSDRIRLSSDSRYQLASESIDERWIGENPIANRPEGKRGMIC